MQKDQIKAAFGAAAERYSQAAPVQDQTAALLIAKLITMVNTAHGRGVEIGCGTGLLTQRLVMQLPQWDWVISDLAPDMVAHCQQNIAGSRADFMVMDGERPTVRGPVDLIVSNLAFQWFDQLEASLHRLLDLLPSGGKLAFTTLGPDSFKEWKQALAVKGATHGMHPYAPMDWYQQRFEAVAQVDCLGQVIEHPYDDARHFLKALKAIGAGVARAGYHPISPAILRQILRETRNAAPFVQSYDVILCVMTKK